MSAPDIGTRIRVQYEKMLFGIGSNGVKFAPIFFLLFGGMLAAFATGVTKSETETDIVNLWMEVGGRVDNEFSYRDTWMTHNTTGPGHNFYLTADPSKADDDILREENILDLKTVGVEIGKIYVKGHELPRYWANKNNLNILEGIPEMKYGGKTRVEKDAQLKKEIDAYIAARKDPNLRESYEPDFEWEELYEDDMWENSKAHKPWSLYGWNVDHFCGDVDDYSKCDYQMSGGFDVEPLTGKPILEGENVNGMANTTDNIFSTWDTTIYALCDKVPMPKVLADAAGGVGLTLDKVYAYLPCNRPSVLDCFQESAFDNSYPPNSIPSTCPSHWGKVCVGMDTLLAAVDEVKYGFGVYGPWRKPTVVGKTPEYIKSIVQGQPEEKVQQDAQGSFYMHNGTRYELDANVCYPKYRNVPSGFYVENPDEYERWPIGVPCMSGTGNGLGCQSWASRMNALDFGGEKEDLILGGVERNGISKSCVPAAKLSADWENIKAKFGCNEDGPWYDATKPITKARAFQHVVLMSGLKALAFKTNITVPLVLTLMEAWEDKLLVELPNIGTKMKHSKLDWFTANQLNNVIDGASESSMPLIYGGYGLMFAFIVFVFINPMNLYKSHVFGGVGGLILVLFAFISALGVFSHLGLKLNATILQVLPFLALGLGVDDMFVLVHTYADLLPRYSHLGAAKLVGLTWSSAGSSVTLTSICNLTAFFTGSMIPLPAVQAFCQCAGIVVCCNYIILITCLPTILMIDYKMSLCFRGGGKVQDEEGGKALEDGGHVSKGGFVGNYYAPFLASKVGKALALLICAALVAFASIGIGKVENGLEIKDIVSETDPLFSAVEKRFDFFSLWPQAVGLRDVSWEKKETQAAILAMEANFKPSVSYMKTTVTSFFTAMLIDAYKEYPEYIVCGPSVEHPNLMARNNYDGAFAGLREDAVYLLDLDSDLTRASEAGKMDFSTGDLFRRADWDYKLRCGGEGDKPENLYNSTAGWKWYIKEGHFFELYQKYAATDAGTFLTAYLDGVQAFGCKNDEEAPGQFVNCFKESEEDPTANALAYSFGKYFIKSGETAQVVDLIEEVRSYIEDPEARHNKLDPNLLAEKQVFPVGSLFIFWEQYVTLKTVLWSTFGLCCGMLFVACLLVLINIKASLFVTAMSALIVIEIYGMFDSLGIKLNAIPSATLIMAIGIAVEFVAHVVAAFESAQGNGDERMKQCLDEVFFPVLEGGVSSILGFSMLATADLKFIRTYFFMIYLVVVLVGLINGLFILPVILSLIGPKSESRSQVLHEARMKLIAE